MRITRKMPKSVEEALLRAFDEGRINLPVMPMTVPGYGRVTSLDAPHRIADAIFRDAQLGGVPFHQSPDGQRFLSASVRDATAVFELCPTALVFGYWNSHAGLRTRGAKVARALYSEIVGFGAVYGAQTGGRLDPLGIPRNAAKIYQASNESEMWTLEASQAKGEKGKEVLVVKGTDKGRPASIGHGNVPPDLVKNDRNEILRRGATLLSAKQTVVLSLAQLRRIHFPDASGSASRERNEAARTVLAALGLAAVALQHEQGYDLRSRCVLYAPASLSLKFVGGETGEYNQTAATAIALLSDGVVAAERAGVVWRTGTVLFEPQKKLVQLYQKGLEAWPARIRTRTSRRMFCLKVEFLTGRYYATDHTLRAQAEWPPHPSRLFSALVDAWASLDQPGEGEEALEWLERQTPPALTVSERSRRDAVETFVPVNDEETYPWIGCANRAIFLLSHQRDQTCISFGRKRRQRPSRLRPSRR